MSKQKNLSRRDFLKGTAAGAIGIAGLSLASNQTVFASSKSDDAKSFNLPDIWDYEADMVVIGTGTSMYGAIKAADSGLSVIAIDAYASPGGTTGLSGGMAWLPNTNFSIEAGDSRENSLTYLKQMRRTAPISDELLEAFVDNCQPMLDFITPLMEATTNKVAPVSTPGYGDFYPELEGGMVTGRTVDFRVNGDPNEKRDKTLWRASYLEAAETSGVEVMTSTKATKFVYRYLKDSDVPEVLGIIALNKDEEEISIKAKKGVLLACGGYDWNEDLKNTFLAVPTKYACSLSTNDGTGLRMSMTLGADLCNMTETFGHITYKEKAEEQYAEGSPCNIMYERMMPRQIIVNQEGRRFFNEACDYDSSWRTMSPYRTYGDFDLANVPCFIIMDRKHIDDYGFNVSAFLGDLDERGVPPYFKEADTLQELAEMLGIDGDGLEAEVEKFNQYCADQYDPDFHRGESKFGQLFKSALEEEEGPLRNLGPIEEGPFYGAELAPAMLGTCGGPKLNEYAQALHVSGEPIGRLYACGNCSGFGGPGPGYGGAGGTIGPGQVIGFIAANHLVKNGKNWS